MDPYKSAYSDPTTTDANIYDNTQLISFYLISYIHLVPQILLQIYTVICTSVLGRLRDLQYIFAEIYETRSIPLVELSDAPLAKWLCVHRRP